MSLRFLSCSKKQLSELERSGQHLPTGRIVDSLEEAEKGRPEILLVLSGVPGAPDTSGPRVDGEHPTSMPHTTIDPAAQVVTRGQVLNLDPYRPPKAVLAGGGLVVRHGSAGPEVVLIHRRGVWDLPKGKLDRGESIEQCAEREVNEELGIGDASIVCPAGTTLHAYAERDRFVIKTTHWFVMRTSSPGFTPQAAEQIERVEWVPLTDAAGRVGFDGLRRLLVRSSSLVSSVL